MSKEGVDVKTLMVCHAMMGGRGKVYREGGIGLVLLYGAV